MRNLLAPLLLLLPLAACNSADNGVRISAEKAAVAPKGVILKPRSEPIFYNGKTYQLDFSPGSGGAFDMAVRGMTAKQQKDAVAISTSSLRYFACPDGMTGKVLGVPAYDGTAWRMQAHCA
jgi:hypothetical protein